MRMAGIFQTGSGKDKNCFTLRFTVLLKNSPLMKELLFIGDCCDQQVTECSIQCSISHKAGTSTLLLLISLSTGHEGSVQKLHSERLV